MTEFENHLKAIFEAYNGAEIDPKLAAELHTPALLALAKKAFEKAEKDTIERAIAWLKSNAVNYIYNYTDSYPDAPFRVAIGCKCWEDLKEYMKNESF